MRIKQRPTCTEPSIGVLEKRDHDLTLRVS